MIHDPIKTASELSAKLREQDKATRIAELKPVASSLMGKFSSKVNELGSKLIRFRAVMTIGGDSGPPIGDGLDALTGSHTAQIRAEHHNKRKLRIYKIACRSEECVVLVCDYDDETGKYVPKKEWRELRWYGGADDEILSELILEFEQWLDQNLKELYSGLVGKTASA